MIKIDIATIDIVLAEIDKQFHVKRKLDLNDEIESAIATGIEQGLLAAVLTVSKLKNSKQGIGPNEKH